MFYKLEDELNGQGIADRLKALVQARRGERRSERRADAIDAIQTFEGLDWNYRAFDAAWRKASGRLQIDADGNVSYVADDARDDLFADVINVLTQYRDFVSPRPADPAPLYTIDAAVIYLANRGIRLSTRALKDHVYRSGKLVAAQREPQLMFTKEVLDAFAANPPARGGARPGSGKPRKRVTTLP